jgi:predicted class III extradiol MEMO1 family dioxygenase
MSQLTLNLGEGSVAFSFTPEGARDVKQALSQLMESLKATATKPAAGKAAPQPPLEYRYTGDVFLEVFCNPNIWATPFAAKVLITLRDDRIRVTSEVLLSQLNDDLNQYLEQYG